MFLVDTSVWIDYLRQKNNSAVSYFQALLDEEIPLGITGVIYQEILQGAATKSDFNKLVDYLGSQRFYHVKDNLLSYQSAANIYFNCRRKGITIRSTIDCLIAQIAIENNLVLLHNDQDYEQIATIVPSLKLYH
jgi:predicted nucleic acid-binding protein